MWGGWIKANRHILFLCYSECLTLQAQCSLNVGGWWVKLSVDTYICMQNEQSMVVKSVSCSLDPEVLYIIQMRFFFITESNISLSVEVIFQFHHFFYIYIGETVKGGCLGPNQAFLTRKFSWRYVTVWYTCKSNKACRNNLCFGEKMLTWILQLALPNKSIVL